MKTLPLNADPFQHEHINRVADLENGQLILIEAVSDYSALPANIKAMLGAQWYELQGLNVPENGQ